MLRLKLNLAPCYCGDVDMAGRCEAQQNRELCFAKPHEIEGIRLEVYGFEER